MSADENKELLARYITEVWDEGNVEAIRDFLSPAFRRHVSPLLPPLDLEGQLERIAGFRRAFPDARLVVEDTIAQDDRVAFRSTIRATHAGDFSGLDATGSHLTVGLLDLMRIEDGLIAEQWGGPDLFDMLRQLGATYVAQT